MSLEADYSALDTPQILQIAFYPRQDSTRGPAGSTDHLIEVEPGVSVSCRFCPHRQTAPSILLFHGNGEVASDYDALAPLYNKLGINLFVADYRGYGASGGTPTFTNIARDAHPIFENVNQVLRQAQHTGPLFVMGRSMGSVPAIELAASHATEIRGLIIESGFASIPRLLEHLGFPMRSLGLKDNQIPNLKKIKTVRLPTLVIHGEYDSLIPLSEGKDLFQNVATEDKRMVIISGADHNDLLWSGIQEYFSAIGEFVSAHK